MFTSLNLYLQIYTSIVNAQNGKYKLIDNYCKSFNQIEEYNIHNYLSKLQGAHAVNILFRFEFEINFRW